MHVTFTAGHLADLCRSRERLNRIVFWGLTALVAFCAGSALYNVFRVDQPWIRIGQVWALGVILYLMAPMFDSGPGRRGSDEPSGRFLLRQHEERRLSFLRLRRRLFLLLPSMAASWWGVVQVRSKGVEPMSWLLSGNGSWPFLATAAGLLILWVVLGKVAEKASRDAEELRRGIDA